MSKPPNHPPLSHPHPHPPYPHHPPPPRNHPHPPPPRSHHPPPRNHYPPPPPPPRNHYPHPPPPPRNHPHPPPPPPRNHRLPAKPKGGGRTTLASCIVAAIFLLFIIIILFIIYFSLFKPKDPKISVTAIQLPTFSLSSNATAVSFTFSLYAAVRNPNHAAFSHFDSSLQLLYAGNQIGFMFIPAGKISAGETKFMAATFSVQSFPISNSPAANIPAMFGPVNRVSPIMEIEARMEMVGRVRVLWFFSHHVNDVSDCRVDVAITDGSVLGFHC